MFVDGPNYSNSAEYIATFLNPLNVHSLLSVSKDAILNALESLLLRFSLSGADEGSKMPLRKFSCCQGNFLPLPLVG